MSVGVGRGSDGVLVAARDASRPETDCETDIVKRGRRLSIEPVCRKCLYHVLDRLLFA